MSEQLLSTAKILIVDDDVNFLGLCKTILSKAGYTNLKTTPDPHGVLACFVEEDPDLLILDVMMPYLDGLQLLELLQMSVHQKLSVPVLMTTALPSPKTRHIALERGAVDLIEKPFHVEDFLLSVRNFLRIRMALRDVKDQNQQLFHELLERTDELVNYQLELKETQLEVIARLARAGEQRDDDTGKHTQRVALTARMIAQILGLEADRSEVIQRAAPLHDVGKIGVPDSILLKPGKLTDDEFRTMQRHCEIGAQLLSGGRSEVLRVAERIALSHHERWDGRGYPLHRHGQDIPIEGRILAVADVFDALTHERPYKKAWPISDATAEISRQSGQQFDPQIVEAFLQLPHQELL